MAMARGPLPKDPAVRQRRNRASTAAELPAPETSRRRAAKPPSLTATLLGLKRGQGGVRPPVHRWWMKAWRSPMAPRWIETDVEVLFLCAQLHQQLQMYLEEGKSITSLASEIRQQEARIGLDVMARRRLDWRIEANRPPDTALPSPSAAADPPDEDGDPRRNLRAVK